MNQVNRSMEPIPYGATNRVRLLKALKALFNETESRIEMHLEARQQVTVTWPDGQRDFAAGERIHTENSYKFTPDGFRALLVQAGLQPVGMWTDPKQWFGVFVATPA